ncbi:hypothetical protein LBMAG27_21700 [Bacteroidota bacterium]|nr:hypothetical protein LBMAG27_21700 [Bacteroidota bacterium]
MMQKKFVSFLLSFLIVSPALFAQPFPSKIGVNLDGIGSPALEFPNVTLTASDWQSVANGGTATTDAFGWPTEDFRVVFFDHRPFNAWNNAPDDPQKYVIDISGTYTLSFKGQATLTSWSDAPIVFQNQLYDTTTNTTTVDIVFPPGGGADSAIIGNYGFFMLNFIQTNYAAGINGVKEIRLVRPDYQHNNPQIFRTAFLNAFSPFSTIRFMNYLNINSSDGGYPNIQTWADRQQPNAPRYTNGAPWETIIALSNYTRRDMWINIPVDADSMYVVELATLINATLRPDVNIYIEYSNEVWNGGFTQYQYNYDAVLLSPEDADIRASTSFDDRRRARRVAKEVIKFGHIFENVLGVSVASRTRIRPVFAWQIGGWLPWYDDVLNWINYTYGPPKNFIYGIASAPYFNEGSAASNATPQDIVTAMSSNSDGNLTSIQTLSQFADQWQIKHLQYEGGPDNGGGSTTNIGNRISANRIPEMKTAVIHNYQDNWFSANANGTAPLGTNDLINYFVISGKVSRYGCWGATEDLNYLQNLSNAPKYDALCFLTGMCGNEPTVSLTTPLNNASAYVNTSVNISATASDPDGTIKRVEFFVGSTLVGVDSIAPYYVQWTPTQIGIVAVLAKSIDNDGKFTFDDANVVEVISNPLTVNEIENNIDFRISPNPASDVLDIFLSNIYNTNSIIEVRNILGKLLMAETVYSGENKMDVSNLVAGIYFITLKPESGKEIVRKIIVCR